MLEGTIDKVRNLPVFHRYPIAKQFFKFAIVGGTAAIINFAFYWPLTVGGLWYIYSAIIGFAISAVYNFLMNKYWTFRNSEKGREAVNQAIKFSVVITIGLVLNTYLIYAITDKLGFDYRLSWLGATAIITAWNFTLNRFWAFKDKLDA